MQNWLSDENQLLKDARRSGKNFMVEDGDASDSNRCAVYCSSNGLYFPNEDAIFIRRIYQENKYDWKSNRLIGVKKHIYIRDVYKQWYTEGLSEDVDSIEQIAVVLKQFAGDDTEFVFLGSSAGAYMSLALGTLLGGIVFASSPQTVLEITSKNWLLKKHYHDEKYAQWYDISDKVCNSAAEQFIFYAAYNKEDIAQLEKIRSSENIQFIPVKTDKHGVVFYPFNVRYLLSGRKQLYAISAKNVPVSARELSCKLCGICRTMQGCVYQGWKRLQRRLAKVKESFMGRR